MKYFIIFLLLILLTLVIFISCKRGNINFIENIQNSKKAISLLVREPNMIWVNFLNSFKDDYDLHIIIDNYEYNTEDLELQYPNIKFIKINDNECKSAGFVNVNKVFPKSPTAWDKALYYFSVINENYDYVWFIEDDVYIPNKKILMDIDSKYTSTDLLCNIYTINEDGNMNTWPFWDTAQHYFELPWVSGLQCICRMSNKLLKKIKDFADEKHELTFLEVLFPTLAHQNNLSYLKPEEFKNVIYSQNYNNLDEIDANNIYHPMKIMNHHDEVRKLCDT